MKGFKFFPLLLLIILCSVSLSESQEKSRYHAFYLNEDCVIPSESFQYEKTMKEFMDLLKEFKYEYPIFVFSTDDYFYYLSTPVGLAHTYIDSVSNAYQALAKEAGDKWSKVFEGFKECYQYNREVTLYFDTLLSYAPAEKDYKGTEKHFVEFTFVYLYQHKTKDFADCMKQWVELYTKNKAVTGFDTYWGGMGMEKPAVVWTFRGKSHLSFLTKYEETRKLMKEDKEAVDKLWEKTLKCVRKMDTKQGYYRADLSYYPEKE